MSERCSGDKDLFFKGGDDELDEVFQHVDMQPSGPGYFQSLRKKGVHAMHKEGGIVVHITGPCPNLQNGACRLGANCLSRQNPADE